MGNAPLITPVILSGGAGTRLWPASRRSMPKQFLPLVGEHSLIQETVQRVAEDARFSSPIVIANDQHRFLVAEQLREVGVKPGAIVLEPVARNTAPAIAAAALLAPGKTLLIMSSDHAIQPAEGFRQSVMRALPAAEDGYLVAFGAAPDRAETGYGYIKAGDDEVAEGVQSVATFKEKPDRETAERYLAEGGYTWNSGIFLFTSRAYLTELEAFDPATVAACRQANDEAVRDLDFIRLDAASFAGASDISIDYAVMERTGKAATTTLDCDWSDVGSWGELWRRSAASKTDNVERGNTLTIGVEGSLIDSSGPLVAALGLKDMVVVATKDAVLVASRERLDEIKQVIDELENRGRNEQIDPAKVYRPWGYYESIDAGDGFQVKHIMVKPGGRLSLQRHAHRSEHWTVVSGTARITVGDDVRDLGPNQSTYVPLGAVHRLENLGDKPVRLIEIQCGGYLGEDDIERLDDIYRRG